MASRWLTLQAPRPAGPAAPANLLAAPGRALALALVVLFGACGGETDVSPPPGAQAVPSTSPPPDRTGPELDQRTAQEQHLSAAGPDLATVTGNTGVRGRAILPFTLTVTDPDTPCSRLQFSADGLPEGLEVVNGGDCTATVSGTARAPAGSYMVTYRVADDGGASDVSVAVFVVQPEP